MLGEQLYSLVALVEPEKAGKLTGMLLMLDNTEVYYKTMFTTKIVHMLPLTADLLAIVLICLHICLPLVCGRC